MEIGEEIEMERGRRQKWAREGGWMESVDESRGGVEGITRASIEDG